MKLSLSVLLVALALCCYQAEASITCPALAAEMSLFVVGSEAMLKADLAQFNAPAAAVDAKMKVKHCVNQIPFEERELIAITLAKILAAC